MRIYWLNFIKIVFLLIFLGFINGTKILLPESIERHNTNVYEEVVIPLSEPAPIEVGKNLIPIESLDKVNINIFISISSIEKY